MFNSRIYTITIKITCRLHFSKITKAPSSMYEELLNFLLARKKRLLSEEEADRLIELIARSMDLCDEYVEKTDNTALIKKILDNVDVEEIINEESDSTREAIDDLFYGNYSDESLDSDLAVLCGADESMEPLARRKFKRGEFGEKRAGTKEMGSERNIEIKPTVEEGGKEANPTEPVSEEPNSSDNPQSDAVTSSNHKFRLPMTPEKEEFRFELGDLRDVKSAGPDFKFYDKDGGEL
jgi:hypothetical protein